jgi:Uri superfamily endonuclease
MYKTYILILKQNKNLSIEIGKVGKIFFKKGYYLYVGSGKRNLEKRLKRHIKREKNIHWHIDYLTSNLNFEIIEIYLFEKLNECELAKKFIESNFYYIKNFGSSDCHCKSHLFFSENLKNFKVVIKSFKEVKYYETF